VCDDSGKKKKEAKERTRDYLGDESIYVAYILLLLLLRRQGCQKKAFTFRVITVPFPFPP
jgi:hypothetical protein